MPATSPATAYDVRIGPTRQLGARLLLHPAHNAAGVAVVEHTLPPGELAAPPHRHTREDEFSIVLEGELTVWEEGIVSVHGPGSFVEKRRGRLHTFWNAGPGPLRFHEIIAPGAFAGYFPEADRLLPADGPPDDGVLRRFDDLNERYGLEMDWSAVPELARRHGLRLA